MNINQNKPTRKLFLNLSTGVRKGRKKRPLKKNLKWHGLLTGWKLMRMANNVKSWPENCGPLRTNSWICLTHNTKKAFWHMIRHWYVLPESYSMNFIPYQNPLPVSRIYTMDNKSPDLDWDLGPTCASEWPRVTQLPMVFPSSSRSSRDSLVALRPLKL